MLRGDDGLSGVLEGDLGKYAGGWEGFGFSTQWGFLICRGQPVWRSLGTSVDVPGHSCFREIDFSLLPSLTKSLSFPLGQRIFSFPLRFLRGGGL